MEMDVFGLKTKTAHKFIKKSRQNSGSDEKSHVGKIRSVGVVADVDLFRIYDFTGKLITSFGLAPNQVQLALLDPSGKDRGNLDAPEAFGEESFGLYGKVKNPALEEFLSKEFDLLINYSSTEWVFTEVILAHSRAKLKAGFDADNRGWQDISVKVPVNNMDTFHDELVKYLKIMNML